MFPVALHFLRTVRGYKVKVRYQAVDKKEKEARRKAISKVILDAVKRLGRPGA